MTHNTSVIQRFIFCKHKAQWVCARKHNFHRHVHIRYQLANQCCFSCSSKTVQNKNSIRYISINIVIKLLITFAFSPFYHRLDKTFQCIANSCSTSGRTNNDFGCGFYTGEIYDQSISFSSNFNKSCVYFLDFNNIDLRCKKYNVDQEWMMTIAYYRNALSKYAEHPIVQKLVA